MAEKQYTLEAVQGRLKQQKSKAMIFLRGEDNIWVRGTFPPRPGSSKTRACQDKFSLHLPANRDGFKAAEKEALRISALIIAKQFDWRDFLNPADQPDFKPAQTLIQEFADEYKSTHTISNHTFNQQWMRIYKKLPQDKPITKEILIAVALQAEKNSRDRKKRCEKLQKLADFIGIVVDLKQYAGKYQVKDRDIPDDLTIAQMWQSIPTAA
ncbi:MAG TPA: hypothetical protein VEZ50_15080, partial [Nodosilinea sp.]|nr:hypothetical protein [Nodosilinea sp.]